jgi:site-specific DNA recombinase
MSKRTASKSAPNVSAGVRVCIYTRVSTQEQARSGLSLDAQVEKARAYCAFKGFTVVEVVEDAGVSGGIALARRPGGARVRELVEAGLVDAVIGCRLDRIFRDAADCLAETKAWDADGIALHLLDLGIDTSSAVGRAFLTVAAGFAELEKNLVGERTVAALSQLRSQGVRLGAAPFGARRTQDADEAGRLTWEAAQDEADAVRTMLDLRAQGMTLRGIVAELDRQGIATQKGGKWAAMTVKRIVDRAQAATVKP